MIGRTLGHYRIVDRLGAGGMGEVYRAEDTRLGRQVAVKVLPAALASDPDRLSRLHREARALAALDHPGIVTVHSVEAADGVDFITMELVDGETLDRAIPPRGLPFGRLLTIATALADALAAAHARGVVHRDLKPGNAMLTRDGRVKVLDFGLARWVEAPAAPAGSRLSTEAVTHDGALLGTAPYMSPEQVEGRAADARSDIFALGTIIYEMATGQRPFRGDSGAAVMSAILRDDPPMLTEARPDLDPALARVVRRCLAKDPDRRFQSALDVRNELDEIARESSAPPPPTAQVPAPPSRRARLAWLVAAVVVAASAVALLLVNRAGRSRSGPTSAVEIRSIAVLPFANLMDDPAQEYFVEGMQEALITTLAKIHPLRVISRTSVMQFKDTTRPIPEIAHDLDVDAVIEGSVLRAGNRVRITAQLIRGANDEHVWAESYDRDVSDVLGLLSEVAEAIAGEVKIALTPEQQGLLVAAQPVRPEVQEAHLLGRQAANEFTREGRRRAIPLFKQALALDPDFAAAWASLASTELAQALFDGVPTAETRAAADHDAHRAIALDPREGWGYGVIGYVKLYFDWDWPAAEGNLSRAVELVPTDAAVRHGYADLLLVRGRIEESLRQVETGRRYDPLNPLANMVLVGHLIFARHFDRALAELDRIEATIPSVRGATGTFRFSTLWQLGRREEALDVLRRRWAGRADDLAAVLDAGVDRGGPEGAVRAVAQALEEKIPSGGVSPLSVASYYALVGDADHAVRLLERALAAREPFILHIRADPSYDPIRADPRFVALIRRIGFPG